MKKHPLSSIKEAFEKSQPSICSACTPVSAKHITQQAFPSTSFEEMGVLILAGGQGTRLGFDGPKGCFELPLKNKKSLFQIHFEKIKAKKKHLFIAIMTSPLNHEETFSYLKANHWFGLSPDQVDLFQQDLIPMCTESGHLFLEAPNKFAEAPAGNGHALFHLYHSSIWKKWCEKKIQYIQVIPIDNPLAEPFDGELLACHQQEHCDLVLKCIERIDPEEKLGVMIEKKGRLMVCEYSEISEEIKKGQTKGKLTYFLGNIGLFSCSMDYIQKMVEASICMPWHLAHKKGKHLLSTSQKGEVEESWIWKFETFIFDIFPHAKSFKIILGDRRKCFAPLKNLFGRDSPEIVVKAMSEDN